MIPELTRFYLNDAQKEWLGELISCISLGLLPKPTKDDETLLTQTLFVRFYYDSERDRLNYYLKLYSLKLLRKLLRERK